MKELRKIVCDVELRAEKRMDGGPLPTLKGHAAVFNSPTDLGYYVEQVSPGAFSASIGQDDIRALWNHETCTVLGRNRAGTLRLSEDATGLAVEIDPPETTGGKDAVISIQRGDVSQMSFGFEALEETWDWEADPPMRTLTKAKLWEVSPVTFPAYPATDIAARSAKAPEKHAMAGDGLCSECGVGIGAPWHQRSDEAKQFKAEPFDPAVNETLLLRLDRL